MLGIPVAGSIPFFMLGVVIYLFFATAIGIFLGTVARSMPQLGLLFMLVYLPMNMLSGGNTRWRACHPGSLILCRYRRRRISWRSRRPFSIAALDLVWPQFLAVAVIGALFFGLAILRFRSIVACLADQLTGGSRFLVTKGCRLLPRHGRA